MKRTRSFIAFARNRKALTAAIILLAAGGVYFIYNANRDDSDRMLTTVERRDISQEVNVTGKVRPVESVDLAFEKSGKVASVRADVGDHVEEGDIIVTLENSELQTQLLQARASVRVEEAKLTKLQEGTRPEEILIAETKVVNAQTSLSGAQNTLKNTLLDAFTKSDDAVRNKVDQFFSNPTGASPQLDFAVNNSQLETNIEQGRVTIGLMLSDWKNHDTAPLTDRVALTHTNLDAVKSFLDNTATAVNGLSSSAGLSQATIDGWKSGVSTARTNVNTALTNFISAEGSYNDAQSSLTLAEQELALARAGTVPQDIFAQQAALEQVRANVANLEAQLYKTSLRAPFDGIVTKRDVKVGEIASAGEQAVSLISAGVFEIIANIPEADIAKVMVGAQANVSLDAYGDDVPFSATVVKMDPAETVVEGVATYQVTLHFSGSDSRILSGMTADLDIITGERRGVLAIPSRLVSSENGEKVVYVADGSSTVRRVVQTGLRGFDGHIEIISGLSEGEQITPAP